MRFIVQLETICGGCLQVTKTVSQRPGDTIDLQPGKCWRCGHTRDGIKLTAVEIQQDGIHAPVHAGSARSGQEETVRSGLGRPRIPNGYPMSRATRYRRKAEAEKAKQ